MRHTKLTAALVGVGTAATLLLPITGAFADSARGRHDGPRAGYEVRHHTDRRGGYEWGARARRDNRRDAYRKGYEAGRRDGRRDAHRRDRRHHRVAFRR